MTWVAWLFLIFSLVLWFCCFLVLYGNYKRKVKALWTDYLVFAVLFCFAALCFMSFLRSI